MEVVAFIENKDFNKNGYDSKVMNLDLISSLWLIYVTVEHVVVFQKLAVFKKLARQLGSVETHGQL